MSAKAEALMVAAAAVARKECEVANADMGPVAWGGSRLPLHWTALVLSYSLISSIPPDQTSRDFSAALNGGP